MPLLIVAITFMALSAVGLARISGGALQRSQAQQGADAAALAGARFGYGEAQRIASANGVGLVSFADQYIGTAHEVDVVVVIVGGSEQGVSASASARWDPPPPPPPPSTTSTTGVVDSTTPEPTTPEGTTPDPPQP